MLLTRRTSTVAGFAALRELGAALRDFRARGKKVLAFGTSMEQRPVPARGAGRRDLPGSEGRGDPGRPRPLSPVLPRGLQDKLGVDVHLFRVGEYKSAAEPYILDAASPEAREADLFWMNDLWQRYLADIASARKLKVERPGRDDRRACPSA